jgi:hypothetical protein
VRRVIILLYAHVIINDYSFVISGVMTGNWRDTIAILSVGTGAQLAGCIGYATNMYPSSACLHTTIAHTVISDVPVMLFRCVVGLAITFAARPPVKHAMKKLLLNGTIFNDVLCTYVTYLILAVLAMYGCPVVFTLFGFQQTFVGV